MTQWFSGVSADRGSIPVWAGFIGAPLLWLAHLQLTYMLVPWVCTTHRHWPWHLLTLVFLGIGVWFIFLCWREWRRVGGGVPSSSEQPADSARTRFVAVVGMMSSALFTLIIAAEHIPTFILHPCWN